MEHHRSILPESQNNEQYAEKREPIRRSKKSRVAKFVANLLRGVESRTQKEKEERNPKWKKLVHFLFPPFVVSHYVAESSYEQPQKHDKVPIKEVAINTTVLPANSSSMENVPPIAENTENDKDIIPERSDKDVKKTEKHTPLNVYVEEKSTDNVALELTDERVDSIEKRIKNVREDVLLEQKNNISQKLEVLQTRLDVVKKKIYKEPNVDLHIKSLASSNEQPNKTEEKSDSVFLHNGALGSVRTTQIEHVSETISEAISNKPSELVSNSLENDLKNVVETADRLAKELNIWLNEGTEFEKANETVVDGSFYTVEIARQEIERIERLIDSIETDLEVNEKQKKRMQKDDSASNGIVTVARAAIEKDARIIEITNQPIRDSDRNRRSYSLHTQKLILVGGILLVIILLVKLLFFR